MKEFIDTDITTVEENGEQTRVPDIGGFETDDEVRFSVYDRDDGTCLTRVTATETKMTDISAKSVVTVMTDDDVIKDDTVPFGSERGNGLENLDQPDIEVDQMIDEHSIDDVLDDEEKRRARIVQNFSGLDRDVKRKVLNEVSARSLKDFMYKSDDDKRAHIIDKYDIGQIPDHLATSTVSRSIIQAQTQGRQVLQDQEITCLMKCCKVKGRERADELTKHTREVMDGQMSDRCRRMLDGCNKDHQDLLEHAKGNQSTPPWDGDERNPVKGN